MRFGVLGAVEARCATGEPIALGGRRSRSLLAMLLLDAGRTVDARRLIEGVYGERAPGDAAHALQSQVSRLRSALRAGGLPGDLVLFEPGGYRLAIDPEDVDVHRFERLAGEGRRAFAGGDHATADRLLREALALWRGTALADVADASFAEAQTARLEELRLAATEDHIEARLTRGEHRALAAELPETVAAHPLRERLRGQLMRALAGSGRQAEALAAFEDARRVLAEELGVDPSPGLRRVHLAVLRAEGPPRAAVPAQLTSFVGREGDLARVGELLREERLVTLTGPGGVGKTRLAIEAGRGREACFVELASVGAGTAVPRALINALGLREAALLPALSGPSEPADRLVAGLTGRAVLLILDGCEQVVDEVARLVHRLLAACPDLRILATSRERLDIAGETLHPVRPLASRAAVRLFTDRAVAVRPGFPADDATLGAAARICRALDGLPLAIELAAARLRVLTVEEVAARLDDRFRLLSRGGRSGTPHHRTLRSAMAWSWDLLTPRERTLAAGLTVFRDGATLDAVARVCGPSEDEVIDLLADLVDKSLVEADEGRYRMLETVREYCAERLAEPATAVRLMDEAIELAGRLGATEDLTRFLVRKADALAAAGDLDAAHTECARAADLARRAGMPESAANARRGLADVARLRGDLAGARALYELALRGCERASISAALTRSRILAGLRCIAEAESGGERAVGRR
ncbi:BTAD domain-containing putative transcriptional regulator [Actinomadura alba]|uniref:AfsR/SARP family transcriptional regulator n=1 Tax=Actinomadura alba TaxID=406431 RepID=A0ABR7LQJ1_9ACTN|nr:BTAD domain-containing putative transcriptional regulator [Actinomadura alba]MBC6466767.1 AfsR/SARP family transcriptional regulator [Actinomadura alba]